MLDIYRIPSAFRLPFSTDKEKQLAPTRQTVTHDEKCQQGNTLSFPQTTLPTATAFPDSQQVAKCCSQNKNYLRNFFVSKYSRYLNA
jgi:hypothetical protein